MEPEEKPTPFSAGAGRYKLIKFLGKGGMGIVWLAKPSSRIVRLQSLSPK